MDLVVQPPFSADSSRADVKPLGFSEPVFPRFSEPLLLSDGTWSKPVLLPVSKDAPGCSVLDSSTSSLVQSFSYRKNILGPLPPSRTVYYEGTLPNLRAVALQERYEVYCRRARAGLPVVTDWWRRPQLPLPVGCSQDILSSVNLSPMEELAVQERRARALICSTSELLDLGECWCAPSGTPLPGLNRSERLVLASRVPWRRVICPLASAKGYNTSRHGTGLGLWEFGSLGGFGPLTKSE